MVTSQSPQTYDWTKGPAKWCAVGVLGGASIVASIWTYMSSRGSAPAVTPAATTAPPGPAVQPPPPAGPTYVFNLMPTLTASGSPPIAAPTEAPAPDLATSVNPPVDDKETKPSALDAARKININTATVEELDLLPGVGRSTAQKIIEYRTKHGKFRTVSELDKVSGIGPAKLEHLRPLVTVD